MRSLQLAVTAHFNISRDDVSRFAQT